MACTIYGQEVAEFTLSITDANNAAVTDSVYWEIEDTLLTGADNTSVFTNALVTDKPTKSFQSPGLKSIIAITDFDDGWENIYQHETLAEVTPVAYEDPVLAFDWLPSNPITTDLVKFSQSHQDTRMVDSFKGRIDTVRVDFYNDSSFDDLDEDGDETAESVYISDVSNFYKKFSPQPEPLPILLEATFWNGWEYDTVSLLKYLEMSNIPPIASFDLTEDGVCIPSYLWNATSIDPDGNDAEITHEWIISLMGETDWNEVSRSIGSEFTYPFQFEGDYKIVLVSTDANGGVDEAEELFGIAFTSCGTSEPCPECPECPEPEDCPDCPDCPDYPGDFSGSDVDCAEHTASVLARYKEAHGLDDGKHIVVVPSLKVVGVSATTIAKDLHGKVIRSDTDGRLGGNLSGRVSGGSVSGQVGGSIKGTIKKN